MGFADRKVGARPRMDGRCDRRRDVVVELAGLSDRNADRLSRPSDPPMGSGRTGTDEAPEIHSARASHAETLGNLYVDTQVATGIKTLLPYVVIICLSDFIQK